MSSSEDAPNRRRFPRRACQLAVRYRHAGGRRDATVLDLTTHGCRLHVEEDLARGTELTLEFERPLFDGARELTLEASGSVAWFRIDAGTREAGIRFDREVTELRAILAALTP